MVKGALCNSWRFQTLAANDGLQGFVKWWSIVPAGVIAHNSSVIARNSGVIFSGYLFCVFLFQHTSVDPDLFKSIRFLQNSSNYTSFRRKFDKIWPVAKKICRKSFWIYIIYKVRVS